MKTRKEKRDMEKGQNYFFELMKIKKHFFKEFDQKMKNVEDNRHNSYIKYSPDILLFMIIIKNISSLKTMRQMTEELNKEECIINMKQTLKQEGLDELPHCDTINKFLSELEEKEIENIREYMIKELLKKRCFDKYRLDNKYWTIILDGTGLYSFNERHCENCLKKEHKYEENGKQKIKTIYYHHVLEAKLLVGDMVLSIDSEFIENESKDVSKQDCEIKAFSRLTKRIKNNYKRLPICIIGDSLYACERVFKQCEDYNWKYIIRFKKGRIKSIYEEFKEIREIEDEEGKNKFETKENKEGNSSFYSWVNKIDYKDSKVNVLNCGIKNKTEEKKFLFVMNIEINKKLSKELLKTGRDRWKIENEGFNIQKTKLYFIEHPNSNNYRALKNHYLLTQIADIIMQLFRKGVKILKEFKKKIKEISSDLLKNLREKVITDEDIKNLAKPIQVRFS